MIDRDQIVPPDEVRYESLIPSPGDAAFAESYHAIRDAILSSFGVPRHVLLGEPMTPEQ